LAEDLRTRAARIRLLIFDVDGVLTDGHLFLGDDGTALKAFHVRDGHGLVMLRESGLAFGVISGRSSQAVATRMLDLGAAFVHQGVREKLPVLEEILGEHSLDLEEVAYVGDDLPDLPVMLRVGLAVAVADAHELILRHSHWQTSARGGEGAAREVCELVLEAQGLLEAMHLRLLS